MFTDAGRQLLLLLGNNFITRDNANIGLQSSKYDIKQTHKQAGEEGLAISDMRHIRPWVVFANAIHNAEHFVRP